MSCHHSVGDPNCSSSAAYKAGARRSALEFSRQENEKIKTSIPDPLKYEIQDVHEAGSYLLMKIQYIVSQKISTNSTMVLVFRDVSIKDVLFWKRIDPVFRDTPVLPKGSSLSTTPSRQSPSPVAIFPATAVGWEDAKHFVMKP